MRSGDAGSSAPGGRGDRRPPERARAGPAFLGLAEAALSVADLPAVESTLLPALASLVPSEIALHQQVGLERLEGVDIAWPAARSLLAGSRATAR